MSAVSESSPAVLIDSPLAEPPEPPAPVTRRRPWVRPLQVVLITLGWAGVIAGAYYLHPIHALRAYALFAHLVFLAVSFGAVLAVELNGLALLVRLTTVGRMAEVVASLDPLIWLGIAGMCTSGLILGPHLDRPLTLIKLVAVLVVALNGLAARDLMRRLRELPPGADRRAIPRELLLRAARVSAVSQLGWWAAVVIGFLTTNA